MSELTQKTVAEWQVTAMRVWSRWQSIQKKDGQALVEYALIVALVAVVVVVALTSLGGAIGNLFKNVTANLTQ